MRAVTVGWTSSEITVRALFDGPVDEDDKESIECVGTEIIAAFPDLQVAVEVLRVDAPESMDAYQLNAWVFMRKERRGADRPPASSH